MIENSCPECGCEDFVTDFKRGEVICDHCGLVIDALDFSFKLILLHKGH